VAQTIEVHSSPNSRTVVSLTNLAKALTATLSEGTLLEIASLTGVRRLWASFSVTVHDLNAFAVQAKFHPSGPYVTVRSAAGDFTTPKGILIDASGDLTILAANATGWLDLDVTGMQAVRIQAKSASATGTLVDVYANASS
jgi:hypothetical protein